MCDTDAPSPEFFHEHWVRARKQHDCCACTETIRKGDLYHLSKGCWDGDFSQFKHCARCWRLFDTLNRERPGEIDLGLDCGEVYEGGESNMLVMAFMSKDDAQRYAQRQAVKRHDDPLELRADSYRRYGNPIEHRRKWQCLADAPSDVRLREVIKEDG